MVAGISTSVCPAASSAVYKLRRYCSGLPTRALSVLKICSLVTSVRARTAILNRRASSPPGHGGVVVGAAVGPGVVVSAATAGASVVVVSPGPSVVPGPSSEEEGPVHNPQVRWQPACKGPCIATSAHIRLWSPRVPRRVAHESSWPPAPLQAPGSSSQPCALLGDASRSRLLAVTMVTSTSATSGSVFPRSPDGTASALVSVVRMASMMKSRGGKPPEMVMAARMYSSTSRSIRPGWTEVTAISAGASVGA
mmetsp:Transcript_32138/g.84878  ORF Transcript_32138/g.84878 Transcript_32138/m.84878 type:complete len:252 (+) Transcript_32138:910-1665(+)